MRFEGDEIIFEAWGEIEKSFSSLTGEKRIEKCAEYGVIYYYRTGKERKEGNGDE
jgi:hypothetical protein